jgi:hypothetical protein
MITKKFNTLFFSVFSTFFICQLNCTPHKEVRPFLDVTPTAPVLTSFDLKYPSAENIVWRMEQDYYIARFTLISRAVDAWFDNEGRWLLAVKEHPFEQLGGKISEAFRNSRYAAWNVEAVNKLERLDIGDIYVVSVANGRQCIDIYYSRLGNLIKTDVTPEDQVHFPVSIPPPIRQVVADFFDNPEVIDIWKGEVSTNVAVVNNESYQVLAFTSDYEWICSLLAITEDDIPSKVWNGYYSSRYGACHVDSTLLLKDNNGVLYLFYLTDDERRRHIVCVKESGMLHSIISY